MVSKWWQLEIEKEAKDIQKIQNSVSQENKYLINSVFYLGQWHLVLTHVNDFIYLLRLSTLT